MKNKCNELILIETIKKEIILSAGIAFGNFLRDIGNKMCEIVMDEIKKSREMVWVDNNKIQGQSDITRS